MGATLRIPFSRIDDWPDGLADIRATGFTLVALSPHRASRTLEEFVAAQPRRVALLLGTEGSGLSDAALAIADVSVRIPISDGVDSLNIAVASGIALERLSDNRFL